MIIDCTLDKTDGTFKANPVALKQPFVGNVFIQGQCFRSQTEGMFERYGFRLVDRIVDSDIVCWLGGSDINPKLYGEKPSGATSWSDYQDSSDLMALEKAGDRFKVGICRGAQLLNCIPNGGKLWQDIKQHGHEHFVTDVITGQIYKTNSIHHQQMRPGPKAELVAWTSTSVKKESEKEVWHKGMDSKNEKDIEALWYEDTKSLLVQWHPELGSFDSTKYFMNLMERYFLAA